MHRRSKISANRWFHRQAFAALIGFATWATSTAGLAGSGDRGTQEEQEACTADVFRLCSNEIPDTDRIVACLKNSSSALSERCRAVMSGRVRPKENVTRKRW